MTNIKKILYIESNINEKLGSEMLESIIKIDGYNFVMTVVPNAFVGLELTEFTNFFCIFANDNLPHVRPEDMLRSLRTIGDMTPMILLSDNKDKPTSYFGYNFDSLLVKPYNQSSITRSIQNLLNKINGLEKPTPIFSTSPATTATGNIDDNTNSINTNTTNSNKNISNANTIVTNNNTKNTITNNSNKNSFIETTTLQSTSPFIPPSATHNTPTIVDDSTNIITNDNNNDFSSSLSKDNNMDKSKSKYYDICKDNNEDAIILDHVVTERLVVNDIQIEGIDNNNSNHVNNTESYDEAKNDITKKKAGRPNKNKTNIAPVSVSDVDPVITVGSQQNNIVSVKNSNSTIKSITNDKIINENSSNDAINEIIENNNRDDKSLQSEKILIKTVEKNVIPLVICNGKFPGRRGSRAAEYVSAISIKKEDETQSENKRKLYNFVPDFNDNYNNSDKKSKN